MLNLAEIIKGDFSQSSIVAAVSSALCDIPGFFFLEEDCDDLFLTLVVVNCRNPRGTVKWGY
jgi:hypothetical protein